MTFVVQTQEGEPDAVSYISVAEADQILADFGKDDEWDGLDEPEKEQHLRIATWFIDDNLSFIGELRQDTQALSWPRQASGKTDEADEDDVKLKDREGRELDYLPQVVKNVTAFIAAEDAADTIIQSTPALKSQRFGDSAETYASAFLDTGTTQIYLNSLKKLGLARSTTSVVTTFRA